MQVVYKAIENNPIHEEVPYEPNCFKKESIEILPFRFDHDCLDGIFYFWAELPESRSPKWHPRDRLGSTQCSGWRSVSLHN